MQYSATCVTTSDPSQGDGWIKQGESKGVIHK